jgi:hypothetical protein
LYTSLYAQEWKAKYDELVTTTLKEFMDVDEKTFDFKEFVAAMTQELGNDQEFLVRLPARRNCSKIPTARLRLSRTSSGSTSPKIPPYMRPRSPLDRLDIHHLPHPSYIYLECSNTSSYLRTHTNKIFVAY